MQGTVSAQEKTIKVGVYDNAPKIFMSEKGKAEGIFIDIIEYIAKKRSLAHPIYFLHMV